MIDLTRTTTAMLEGLQDVHDQEVWMSFDGRYRPILLAFAGKLGLSDADAADVAQETLLQFVKEYRAGKYDRTRGRLRSWLIAIARFRVAGLRRGQARRREYRGESALLELPGDAQLTEMWEQERRTQMLREALVEMRRRTKTSETTLRAFELLMIEQKPRATVAEELGISIHDVYLAKSRVAQKLRDILERLEQRYDADG